MKVTTWNVNSIRSRVERAAAWVEAYEPDVLCLQELKALDEQVPVEPFEDLGYEVQTFGQKTYNGVALVSRSPLEDVERGFPGDPRETERRVISATVEGIRVICVYVPNGQNVESEKFPYKLEWLARLDAWIRDVHEPTDPVLLLGDFNIAPDERDVHDPELYRGRVHFHPKEHEALARFADWGFRDLFRKHHEEAGLYSWWDYRRLGFPKDRGLRLDLILGTPPVYDRCSACSIDRNERKGAKPSDHAPVTAVLD